MDSQLAQLGFEREDSGLSGLEIWRNGEGVVALALNQAPVNSLSMELLGTLQVALNRISAAGPRALILTSKLRRVFSAGLDLQALHAPSEADFCQFWRRFEDVWRSLYLFPFKSYGLHKKSTKSVSRRWQARPPHFTPPKLTAYSKRS